MATIFSTPTTVTVAAAGGFIQQKADWLPRSTWPRGFWACEWSGYSTALQATNSPGWRGTNTPTSNSNWGSIFQLITDPTRVTSGNALRIKHLPISEGNWTLFLGGNRNNIPANYFTKFYVQFV